MYRCQLDFCRFFNKVKLFIDSVLIDWLFWQLKGEGGRAYEVFKNKVKLRIPWTRNNPGQVERKAKNRKNISFIVNWPFLITLFQFFFKLLLLLLFSTFESYRLWSVTAAGKNTLKSVTLPSFKVIIANEAIAPLAKSQNFTQSHICTVAGKNVFPTTEKLVWTNSQNQ